MLQGADEDRVEESDDDLVVEEECMQALSRDNRKKYRWDKQHNCKFCHKMVLKMSTHLIDCHYDKKEVKNILEMTKGSKERRRAFIALQNQGDFRYNMEVLRSGKGTVIPKYRTRSKKIENLLACRYCKGLYQKRVLFLHSKNCSMKPTDEPFRKGDALRQGRLLLPVPSTIDEDFYRQVITRMRDDDIKHIVKTDPLILEYGRRLFYRRDLEEHTANQISSKMRELARLLQNFQEEHGSDYMLSELVDGAVFDKLVDCVKTLAKFDTETHQFQKPWLATQLGHALRKCSSIKKSIAVKNMKDGDPENSQYEKLVREAERFDSAFIGDWYDHVSSTANQSKFSMQRNKPKLIPSIKDVSKVLKILDEKMEEEEDYPSLVKATLCAIATFNRKRGGEVQRMKIKDLENINKGNVNTDVLQSLNEAEKKMVNFFDRVEIRGKFNRTVPILLTPKMKTALQRIKEMRKSRPELTSVYLFATPTGQRPYRGDHILKDIAEEAKVENIQFFNHTSLRKQAATLSQAIGVTELQQDQLATFLGHDIRIHREFYRLPQDLLQKARVAKILMSLNHGEEAAFEDINNGKIDNDVIEDDEDNTVIEDDEDNTVMRDVADKFEIEEEATESSEFAETTSSRKRKNRVFDDDYVPVTKKKKTSKTWDDDYAPVPKKQKTKKTWSTAEKVAIKASFRVHLVTGKVAQKDEIIAAQYKYPELRLRTWRNIKDFVRNTFSSGRTL